jgi:hypothetical protein
MFSAVDPTTDMGRAGIGDDQTEYPVKKDADPRSGFIYFGFTRDRRSSLPFRVNGL